MRSGVLQTGRGSRRRRVRSGGSTSAGSVGSLRLVRDERFIAEVVGGGFMPARSAGSATHAVPLWWRVLAAVGFVVLSVVEIIERVRRR